MSKIPWIIFMRFVPDGNLYAVVGRKFARHNYSQDAIGIHAGSQCGFDCL